MPMSMPRMPQSIGRFRVDAFLGRGGMGEVYRGFDPTLRRAVAIKTLSADCESGAALDRLYREAEACARLTHPNIVTVFEAGESNGTVYIAMEYLQGENLAQALAAGRLTFEGRLRILLSILDALDHAHGHGVIHRDIKPTNVFCVSGGAVKLLDFGVARVLSAETLTHKGSVLGTPYYASPEQLRAEEIDGRTDVYSTGALAYEMFSGRRPFEGENDSVAQVALRVIAGALPPMGVVWTKHFPEVERIVMRAMAKTPAARYQSAAEMRAAIEAFHAASQPRIAILQARLTDVLVDTTSDPVSLRDPEAVAVCPTTVPAMKAGVGGPVAAAEDLGCAAPLPPAPIADRPRWSAGAAGLAAAVVAAIGALLATGTAAPTGAQDAAGPARVALAQASNPATAAPVSLPERNGSSPRGTSGAVVQAVTDGGERGAVNRTERVVGPPPAVHHQRPRSEEVAAANDSNRARTGVPGNPGLSYRLIRRTAEGGEMEVDSTHRFRSGEGLRFIFEPNIAGHLYVAQLGSSGRWTVLFPDPDINGGTNEVKQFERYSVPSEDWFMFDSTPGTEQVFVFLSRAPLEQLPGLNQPTRAGTSVQASLVEDLQSSIRSRDLILQKERTQRLPGGQPGQVTYVVNRDERGSAVSALISLHHDR
jgi:hypothetical protein